MDAEGVARLMWARTVAEIALMPGLAARLAARHVSDEHGRCRACTLPGRGIPHVRWPCGLAAAAEAATLLLEPAPAPPAEQ